MTPSEQKSCSSLAPGLNQGDDGDTAPDVEARIVSLKASSGPQGKDRVSGFVVKHVGLGPERLVGLPEPLGCWGQSIDDSSLVAWRPGFTGVRSASRRTEPSASPPNPHAVSPGKDRGTCRLSQGGDGVARGTH